MLYTVFRVAFAAAAVSLLAVATAWTGPVEDFKEAARAQERGDCATALRIFQRLANQGIPGALYAMGAAYFEGTCVPRDYATALKWHRMAADKGHPGSQYEIGAFYDQGIGVSKNPSEAASWFRRAAEQGYGTAQVNLGAMYSMGEGVPRDAAEAYKWFIVAAAGGGYLDSEKVKSEAARRRDAFRARLTATQRAEGEERARLWKAKTEEAAIAAVRDLARLQEGSPKAPPPPKGTAAEVAASFALSTCYDSLDDISRVKSYARLVKWEALSADAKNVIRPVGAGGDYEAWRVEEQGQQFFVSVHRGTFRGKPAEVCQVFASVPAEPLIAGIAGKVRIGPPTAFELGLQTNELYQLIQHPTGRPALLLVGKSKDKTPLTIVGFMGVR